MKQIKATLTGRARRIFLTVVKDPGKMSGAYTVPGLSRNVVGYVLQSLEDFGLLSSKKEKGNTYSWSLTKLGVEASKVIS